MVDSVLQVKKFASLIGAVWVLSSTLLEQSVSVLVQSVNDGVAHIPLSGLQHLVVNPAVDQLKIYLGKLVSSDKLDIQEQRVTTDYMG